MIKEKKYLKVLMIGIAIFALLVSFVSATEYVEVITFQWDQDNRTFLSNWEMHWGDVAGGPYIKLIDLPYGGQDVATYESGVSGTVTGIPGSTVRKYFVLRACGTPPEQGYECSGDSNEVFYDFKIPKHTYEVPVNFKVKTNEDLGS